MFNRGFKQNNMTESISKEIYDETAEEYAAAVDTKDVNAFYERPAVISLIENIKGKQVLELGCGNGFYTEWLINNGANVFAVDYCEKFVEITKTRISNKAVVKCQDITKGLDFTQKNSVDLVLAPLVLDYCADWISLFSDIADKLKPGGSFIFSVLHPCFGREEKVGTYFDVRKTRTTWGAGFSKTFHMEHYKRPLSYMTNSLLKNNFRILNILEPKPTQELIKADPEFANFLLNKPLFIIFKQYCPVNFK